MELPPVQRLIVLVEFAFFQSAVRSAAVPLRSTCSARIARHGFRPAPIVPLRPIIQASPTCRQDRSKRRSVVPPRRQSSPPSPASSGRAMKTIISLLLVLASYCAYADITGVVTPPGGSSAPLAPIAGANLLCNSTGSMAAPTACSTLPPLFQFWLSRNSHLQICRVRADSHP